MVRRRLGQCLEVGVDAHDAVDVDAGGEDVGYGRHLLQINICAIQDVTQNDPI